MRDHRDAPVGGHRRFLPVVAAAVGLVLGGFVLARDLQGSSPGATTNPGPRTHTVTVHTTLGGPRTFYFEGALSELALSPADAPDDPVAQTSGEPVGGSYEWPDLEPGHYVIGGAVRPCGGNCGNLGPPTDSCQGDIDLGHDVTVWVTFHYGQRCEVAILAADETVVPSVGQAPSALQAKAALEDAGLEVEINTLTCGPTDLCQMGVASVSPEAGTVVPTGSTVTLNAY